MMVEYTPEELRDRKTRVWYVLHVKPRAEKKVAEYLRIYKFWHHLPLIVKTTRVQRRKVRRELPLFPGYVFCRLDADGRLAMLKTNLLVRVIEMPSPRETIHQLRQIEHAGRSCAALQRVEAFVEGELVRVKAGPFYGLEGRVKYDRGGASIVLNLTILGQAVAVSISPADCEPIAR